MNVSKISPWGCGIPPKNPRRLDDFQIPPVHYTLPVTGFVTHITRLYEREPGEPFDSARLRDYVSRWVRWKPVGVLQFSRAQYSHVYGSISKISQCPQALVASATCCLVVLSRCQKCTLEKCNSDNSAKRTKMINLLQPAPWGVKTLRRVPRS